jgi:hypothetical protein
VVLDEAVLLEVLLALLLLLGKKVCRVRRVALLVVAVVALYSLVPLLLLDDNDLVNAPLSGRCYGANVDYLGGGKGALVVVVGFKGDVMANVMVGMGGDGSSWRRKGTTRCSGRRGRGTTRCRGRRGRGTTRCRTWRKARCGTWLRARCGPEQRCVQRRRGRSTGTVGRPGKRIFDVFYVML